MDVKQLKHEYRLRQWTEIVTECHRSGIPVREWCTEQGISRQTYYYWQKQVREAAALCTVATSEGTALSLSEKDPATSGFVRITPPESSLSSSSCVAVSVRMGFAECSIMNGAGADVIERTLMTLSKIC
jgi:transposase-like protein